MTTIDLGTPPPRATSPVEVLDAMPRRVALTLPELRLAAEHASGAPLPFDLAAPRAQSALDARLGQSRGSAEEHAYAAALAALHDPADSLARRGLLAGDALEPGLAGAMGLLATPSVALDLDVSVGGRHLHAWHRRTGDAVASLATVDGLVFELSWFATATWARELGRVAVLPEDVALSPSSLTADRVDLPFELVAATADAHRSGRFDLIAVLADQHQQLTDGDGRPLGGAELVGVLSALTDEARGRLRAMSADVSGESTSVVGVVSWTLLADGWRALRPHTVDDELWVEVSRIEPADLAADLAPVLAEVLGVSA